MHKTQMYYFKAEDVLHLAIAEGEEHNSVELSPNITAEINAEGELIGIEILNASSFLQNFIMESVQAKLLDLKLAS